jgi:hypothetical protein
VNLLCGEQQGGLRKRKILVTVSFTVGTVFLVPTVRMMKQDKCDFNIHRFYGRSESKRPVLEKNLLSRNSRTSTSGPFDQCNHIHRGRVERRLTERIPSNKSSNEN